MNTPAITDQLLLIRLPARFVRVGDIVRTKRWGLREVLALQFEEGDAWFTFSGKDQRRVCGIDDYVEVVAP